MDNNIIVENKHYTINETCSIIGVCRNTLLSYTKRGFIKCSFNRARRRYYTGKNIKLFINS